MFELSEILKGFATLLDLQLIMYLSIGFLVGVFFGAVPGLTSMLAITLLLPITYSMSMVPALVMCMGIYMAGIYSGSITATTINIPGAPSAMMTAIEGHAMMKRGQGAKALGHAAYASMIGGTIGALLLILISPLAVQLALKVRTPGKFSLIFFALVVIGLIDRKNWIKGAVATMLGLIISTIGMDVAKPVARFTFGSVKMLEGVELIPLIIGSFAISELFIQSEVSNADYREITNQAVGMKIRRRDFLPTRQELREIGIFRYLKSSIIGYFIGILPGAGGSMAGFVSYAEAKRSSKYPEKYGDGSIEGIACTEAANNAMCGGALVPMLSFGIPGDGTTAIILGVLMVYGLIPGPELLTKQIHLIAPMYAALLVAALILIPLSLMLFGPYYVKIVKINRLILYSSIALVSIMGAYSSTYSFFQMFLSLLIGTMMYALRKQSYPAVPFILAALLGPLCEGYLRRTLSISQGNPLVFLTQLDSLFFLVLTVVFAIFFLKGTKHLDEIRA
ncbi:tricarboxylate transporter [candidate division KSB3 bacterium]|uniref:Tricarboxylate transporter n=1 Tax=candidate division KSB3 bacterium TaxID=2044937 RepID=A0A9D5JWD7_9BACT|nr:tricarboxylate transporter [candidate division KSB3 bacterium]MBD3325353.1 tricarboxylate transporter [candidate division KSB3 bacterium]